jgi:two-component system cell cycle sensor histidine kinase/response regulator CckA
VKHLTCLVAVNRDMHERVSIDELCRRTVEHLIPAMQFPEIAVSAIEFAGKRFTSGHYIEGLPQSLHAEIGTDGVVLGHVRVSYLEEKPFLIPEEQHLLDVVAELLSTYFARARAEEGLVESEKQYRDLVETAHDLIWAVDAGGRITFLNQASRAIYGYAPEELIGRPFFDVLAPEHRARYLENFPKVLRSGITYLGGVETEVIDRDGNRHTLLANSIIQYDNQGNVVGSTGTSTDITERKRTEEALRTAEERMRFALESADVGIWDMDHATGMIRWSATIEAHHGLRPGTFGGTFEASIERIHPDDRPSVLETFAKAVKSGSDFSVEYRVIWPDGTVRWLRGAGRVRLGEHGEPVRTVGISMDVTERHGLEQQYRQAQKMEAVGRLAGGVAHDFNNLLTVILGYCDMLLADFDPDDPRQIDIAEIRKAGEAAAGLTSQLLAFSRKQIIQPTLLDLNAVVSEMRPMLQRLIRQDVTVVVGLTPEAAPIRADRGQVEQIIMNLAVNARDAMPHGGTLTIETANLQLDADYAKWHLAVKPGPYVALTVTDTGAGMTPDVRARVFEPFFTTKELGKGTGLGLATVDGVVAQSGGSIEVHSEVGKGTSFKVYFPRADATKEDIEATEEPPPVARRQGGGETVLVVDDTEALCDLARRLLERQGYTVLVATNAEEARLVFERNASIDVLLTDVVMPGASGPELTRDLVERRPSLKVIYMSGYTESDIQQGLVDRKISFLHKPFTADALGRKMREVMDG